MELNGFMIGPEIKKLFKIKVDTPTAGHPVVLPPPTLPSIPLARYIILGMAVGVV